MISLAAPAATPQDVWLPLLSVVAVIGLGMFLTISIRAKIARRNQQLPTARQLIDQVKSARSRYDQHGAQAEMAEMVETARRLGAQLDNKAQRLDTLIRHADERIAVLQGAVEAAQPEPPPAVETPPARQPRPIDPLTRVIYQQADAGLSPVEIAQQLDEQVGKVELILALRE